MRPHSAPAAGPARVADPNVDAIPWVTDGLGAGLLGAVVIRACVGERDRPGAGARLHGGTRPGVRRVRLAMLGAGRVAVANALAAGAMAVLLCARAERGLGAEAR